MNSGIILIIFALLFSCGSLVFYLRSLLIKKNSDSGRNLYYGSTLIIGLAFATLLAAFLNNEFQYAYVYENSSRSLETLFRISALWAGREGSYLLWVLLISVLGLFLIHRDDGDEPVLASVVLLFQVFFLGLLIVDSPFRYIWKAFPGQIEPGQIPPDGLGLHPLLQDFWMSIHPPMLFLGYASAIIPAAYAITALLKGSASGWIERARGWVLFSALTLGLGNILGALWAYSVLGWGGFWAWDPVENSSLIPWLVVIILLHTMLIQRKKGSLVRLNLALALLYPVLVFIGTYLTRSGLLSDFSVHSFSAYRLSMVLLCFIIFLFMVGTVLLIRTWKKIKGNPISQDIYCWDNLMLFGIITFGIFTVMVQILSVMPILSGLFASHKSSVTADIYNLMVLPFAVLILFFLILSSVRLSSLQSRRVVLGVIAGISLAVGIVLNISGPLVLTKRTVSVILSAEAVFLTALCFFDLSTRRGIAVMSSRLSHAGLAIFILGALVSGFYSVSEKKEIGKDERENILGKSITFLGFHEGEKSSLVFRIETEGSMSEYNTAYYISSRTNSLVREPLILRGVIRDTYIVPEEYRSGFSRSCVVQLNKGEETNIANINIRFINFRVEGMGTDKPVVWVDLEINGKKITPGLAVHGDSNHQIIKEIPGTDRKVAVQEIDPREGTVELFIIPGRTTAIPQDTVMMDVSIKYLISLVWLGAIILSIGISAGFLTVKRKENG